MAITRIWQSGAETGDLGEFDTVNGGFQIYSSVKKTGAYSFRSLDAGGYGTVEIPSTSQSRIGFYWQTNAQDQSNVTVVQFQDVYLRFIRYSNYFELMVLGASKGFTPVFSLSEWFHVGLDVKKNATTGWADVYFDGVLAKSFSGNTGATQITNVKVGAVSGKPSSFLYDDIYVDDTTGESSSAPLPLKRFYYLTPNATGNYSQWNKSSGSDGYDLVDEVPPSDTDYIESDAVGEKESYNMTTYTIDTGEAIEAVIPTVRAAKSGANEQIKLGTRLSSTDLQGSALDLGSSPDYVWERQTTKPGGGSWAQADLDAFEVLAESAGSF